MLGVDLPSSAKLKSPLAPGSFAVKGLIVIKSLFISPELVLLNEAACLPPASHPVTCFRALLTEKDVPLLCRGLSRNLSKLLQKLSLGTTPTLLSVKEIGLGMKTGFMLGYIFPPTSKLLSLL